MVSGTWQALPECLDACQDPSWLLGATPFPHRVMREVAFSAWELEQPRDEA